MTASTYVDHSPIRNGEEGRAEPRVRRQYVLLHLLGTCMASSNLCIWISLLAVAGCASRTAVAPLERLKILFQVQDYIKKDGAAGGAKAPAKYRSIGQSLRQIHAEEGLRGYFRGNGANCVRVFPYVAIQFAAFEKLKPLLMSEGAEALSPLQKLFGGAIAGVLSVCVTYPLDAARARLTVQGGLANTAHTGIFNTLSTVVRAEGLRGVYRGVLPTIWGIAPYVGLNFTVFETLRTTVPRNDNGEPDALYLLGCGALAGACGQTAAYPMDILRRRFQLSTMRGDATEYTSTLGGLRTIVREEGVRGLYKGLAQNFIKVVPSIAIMFTSNELLRRVIKTYEL
jgi:solute carrier family 25 phosphate transporter 23/24/25/41